MSNQYFLFVSNVMTAALVCGDKLAFMKDYEYTNRVLDQVYSDLQGIEIDEAFVVLDVLISRDICKNSYVVGEVNGKTCKRNVLASTTDVDKILHLLKSAGIENCNFIPLTSVLPSLFFDAACVVYENNYGINVFLFDGEKEICEPAIDAMCVNTARSLLIGTGIQKIRTVADNDRRHNLQIKHSGITEQSECDNVEYLLSIFEASREIAPVFGLTATDFSRITQLRADPEGITEQRDQVEFITASNEKPVEKKAVQRSASVTGTIAVAGSAMTDTRKHADEKKTSKNGSSEKISKRRVKSAHDNDTVEVMAEYKRKSCMSVLASMITTLMLLLTAAGFVGNLYFKNALADVTSTNDVLMNQLQAYRDEATSLRAYAENEYSSETLRNALGSCLVKESKDRQLYELYCSDMYVRAIFGFDSQKALKRACKAIGKEYKIVYQSVNDDVLVNQLDIAVEETGAIVSVGVSGVLKPMKYKCVLVLTE